MTKAVGSKPAVDSTVLSLVSTGFRRLLQVLHHLCLLLTAAKNTYFLHTVLQTGRKQA